VCQLCCWVKLCINCVVASYRIGTELFKNVSWFGEEDSSSVIEFGTWTFGLII